jgi:hypothetical protein
MAVGNCFLLTLGGLFGHFTIECIAKALLLQDAMALFRELRRQVTSNLPQN